MEFIFLILFVALFLIMLLFFFALRVRLVFDSERSGLEIALFWLDPIINTFVVIEEGHPVLKVYFFDHFILKKELRGKALQREINKRGGMELLRLSDPTDINVNVKYGFSDPFATGIACGAISMASQFIRADSINQTPDFMSMNDYIYLEATAKVNLGSALVKYLKSSSNK